MAGRGAGVLGVGFWVLGVTFSLDSGPVSGYGAGFPPE